MLRTSEAASDVELVAVAAAVCEHRNDPDFRFHFNVLRRPQRAANDLIPFARIMTFPEIHAMDLNHEYSGLILGMSRRHGSGHSNQQFQTDNFKLKKENMFTLINKRISGLNVVNELRAARAHKNVINSANQSVESPKHRLVDFHQFLNYWLVDDKKRIRIQKQPGIRMETTNPSH